jgi:FkbH-like protein
VKLTEAIKIINQGPAAGIPFPVTLACGFSPLHVQTFLAAHLQKALPERKIRVHTGLYGNMAGTIEEMISQDSQAAAIILEWTDLDPRLGYRQTGGWGPSDLADILAHTEHILQRLEAAIQQIPPSVKTALCLPTLALPPVFFTPGWQSSEAEMRLHRNLAAMAASVARLSNVAIVSRQQLDEVSDPATRFDLKSELFIGFPYTLSHAYQVAAALGRLIQPFAPKKGLITDLDDTLWHGIVGEIGPDQVAWDLDSHNQIHGLYQQTLRALAEQGVLVAIASKNDPDVVQKALERQDILISLDRIFPVEVHWDAKSGSVKRILSTWNIGADSVVFVDDSPMELAEVEAAHPSMECLLFPKNDYAAAWRFVRQLRDLFGKSRVTEEDALRLESIRQGAALQQMAEEGGSPPEAFLAQMKARVTLHFTGAGADSRAFELVNKTNQFNLNGRRYTESDWGQDLDDPNTFVVLVAYEDKFGPLGKIAVLRGKCVDRALHISTWVMSCRAFARRIEFQCLRVLFDRFDADAIHFEFTPTAKNGPVQEFFTGLRNEKPTASVRLERAAFESQCPALYHTVAAI